MLWVWCLQRHQSFHRHQNTLQPVSGTWKKSQALFRQNALIPTLNPQNPQSEALGQENVVMVPSKVWKSVTPRQKSVALNHPDFKVHDTGLQNAALSHPKRLSWDRISAAYGTKKAEYASGNTPPCEIICGQHRVTKSELETFSLKSTRFWTILDDK